MNNVVTIVFEAAVNGGVMYSAKGVGSWITDPDNHTAGVRFAGRSLTARHPADWPQRELGHIQWRTLATADAEYGR